MDTRIRIQRGTRNESFHKKRRFAVMVLTVFIILFVLSMCFCSLTATSPKVEAESEVEVINLGFENINMIETTEPITEIVTEQETVFAATYSDDDLYYLSAAVCREAGGVSEEIQLLVANVIINRVNSSRFPNTIYDVLTQKKQYGTMWKDGISFPSWATESVKAQCYSVARRILDGERYCPDNVVFQAGFKQGSGVYKYFREGYYFCYC